MKNLILVYVTAASLAVASCNSNSSSTDTDKNKMNSDKEMPMATTNTADKDIKIVSHTFTNVDPAVSAFMKSMVQDYLAIKNALTNSNESKASSAAGKMYDVLKGFDKSLLTADQKKVYDGIEDDLREHAEHISKSKLEHQRDHFSMMSSDMYDMVKAFGAGMALYHDHCPMYKDGSMWLSESKEIRNPYYGEKMMTCGSVEEMFQ